MATYKVPQDVEADDKLLGPFSFRQFVYLIIVAASMGVAWMLAQIFVGLVIIPMPFILFFGILALPLKKDQPMETYMAAIFSFYFIKPRKRTWEPDGIESLVEITAPRQVEPERTKGISQNEASARLSYLTDIIDSRGWAVRGTGIPNQGITNPNDIPDMLDSNQAGSQRLDRLLEQSNSQKRQGLNQQIHQQYTNPSQPVYSPAAPSPGQPLAAILQQEASAAPQPSPVQPIQTPQTPQPAQPAQPLMPITAPAAPPEPAAPTVITAPTPDVTLTQTPVVQPQSEPQSASNMPPSPAIIELANHSEGLTVADVAQQAARIRDVGKGLPEDEVNISLH